MHALNTKDQGRPAASGAEKAALLSVSDLALLASALCWRLQRAAFTSAGKNGDAAECMVDLHRFHVLLLQQRDRSQKKIIALLGMRRLDRAAAASKLKRQGLLEYHRGVLTVLDRTGVEAAVCGCHAICQGVLGAMPKPLERSAGALA